MFFKLFFFFCLAIYLISIVEVIGSYFLSMKEFGNYSTIFLQFALFIPPLAPIFALAIYTSADELYKKRKSNVYEIDESLYGYILHGFNTIGEWAGKHSPTKRERRKTSRKLCPVIQLYRNE